MRARDKLTRANYGRAKAMKDRTTMIPKTIAGLPYTEKDDARYWAKVNKHPYESMFCWLWTGTTDSDGYGTFSLGGQHGKMLRAHRVSWELANGPFPDQLGVALRDKLVVCHGPCDRYTRRCVNPKHLHLGTQADNRDDLRLGHFRDGITFAALEDEEKELARAFEFHGRAIAAEGRAFLAHQESEKAKSRRAPRVKKPDDTAG